MAYEFKGYDWCELAQAWGIPLDEGDDSDAVNAEAIRKYMQDHVDGETPDQAMVTDLKAFIAKLVEEEHGYDGPIWKALLEIQHDRTLCAWVTTILERMWT